MVSDKYRNPWSEDFNSLLGATGYYGNVMWGLFKNYVCHQVVEQLYEDGDRSSYDIIVAPIGKLTIVKDNDKWTIQNIDWSNDFIKTLEESIRSKESNLYRQLTENVAEQIKLRLKEFGSK